ADRAEAGGYEFQILSRVNESTSPLELPNGDVPIYFVARAKKQWDWGMKKTIACVVAITLTFLLSPVAADEFRGALV
ncbi:hypothetical protein, partial [Escherichia coli]|uniref:hypothetical protein n=1 Tax=Escherichia coli TaxID=562 RepID=UPI0013D3C1F8